MVERGRAHADAHVVVRAQRRLREIVAELELFEPAVRVDGECSHPILPRHGYNSRGACPAASSAHAPACFQRTRKA